MPATYINTAFNFPTAVPGDQLKRLAKIDSMTTAGQNGAVITSR